MQNDDLPPDPNAKIADAMAALPAKQRNLAMAIIDRVQVLVGNQQLREDEHYQKLIERIDAANDDRKQILEFLKYWGPRLEAIERDVAEVKRELAGIDTLKRTVADHERRIAALEK